MGVNLIFLWLIAGYQACIRCFFVTSEHVPKIPLYIEYEMDNEPSNNHITPFIVHKTIQCSESQSFYILCRYLLLIYHLLWFIDSM